MPDVTQFTDAELQRELHRRKKVRAREDIESWFQLVVDHSPSDNRYATEEEAIEDGALRLCDPHSPQARGFFVREVFTRR